jgi:hypothetical protein
VETNRSARTAANSPARGAWTWGEGEGEGEAEAPWSWSGSEVCPKKGAQLKTQEVNFLLGYGPVLMELSYPETADYRNCST